MLTLLLACTGPSPETPPVAPIEPSEPAEATPPTDDGPVAHPAWPQGVEVLEAPFRSEPPPVPMQVIDTHYFHGWSDNRAVWEVRHPGMGGASCDMWAELQVVGPEGVSDSLRFQGEDTESDECPGPPEAQIKAEGPDWLAARQLHAGGVGNGGATMELTGDHLVAGEYESAAGYVLTLGDKTHERPVEEFVWTWAINEVFWSPDGARAAVVMAGTGIGFEGYYTRYELVVLSL
jgi:hypothetical protein